MGSSWSPCLRATGEGYRVCTIINAYSHAIMIAILYAETYRTNYLAPLVAITTAGSRIFPFSTHPTTYPKSQLLPIVYGVAGIGCWSWGSLA